MKKVRVLREMPFARVGTILEIDSFLEDIVGALRAKGYVEWLEEDKSLEEKFRDRACEKDSHYWGMLDLEKLAQIAKDHYLAVFDKIRRKKEQQVGQWCSENLNDIRKALENS